MIALALILGAVSRRLVGWGGCPRWPGLLLAALGVVVAMWGHPSLAILMCAVAVPLAYGLPYHGETMHRPVLMGLRNGTFTAVLAAALWFGFGINAWAYAPMGVIVGAAYWAAKRYAPEATRLNGFYDGWVSAAELALGALLVGGLLLLSSPAKAHGEQGWVMKYTNADGVGCCHPTDTAPVSHEEANAAHVGTVIVAHFPTGDVPVVVNKIMATEDKQGRAFITTYGCLFRQFGG